jgi:23S rRNA (pseudouridine1915-N3)-methyltransferase
MRIAILGIGKLKRGPELEICADYEKRLKGMGRPIGITGIKISEFAEARAETAAQRSKQEASVLAAQIPAQAVTIALDERGKALSSTDFAAYIEKQLARGTADLVFLIGGPDGHAEPTRSGADMILSLGAMTWPHRLARLMLLEQIYRSVTILVNHPYHRA